MKSLFLILTLALAFLSPALAAPGITAVTPGKSVPLVRQPKKNAPHVPPVPTLHRGPTLSHREYHHGLPRKPAPNLHHTPSHFKKPN